MRSESAANQALMYAAIQAQADRMHEARVWATPMHARISHPKPATLAQRIARAFGLTSR